MGMGFSYFLAVSGMLVSTAVLGFTFGGVHETAPEPSEGDSGASDGKRHARWSLGRTEILMVILAVSQSLVLFGSRLIEPMWLMYLLLAGVPATVGYVGRRLLAHHLSGADE